MTPIVVVHQQRVAVVTHAVEGGNVSETSRFFGVSRKTIHQWKMTAETYGMEGLRRKDRRPPQMPNATPTWVIDKLLQLAVLNPTRGLAGTAPSSALAGMASPSPGSRTC